MHRLAIVLAGGILLIAFHAFVSPAAAGNAEILEQECHKQLKLGGKACACIGERAETQLSEQQQTLVVALVTKDQAARGASQAKMTVEELTEAAEFMQDAPKVCAAD